MDMSSFSGYVQLHKIIASLRLPMRQSLLSGWAQRVWSVRRRLCVERQMQWGCGRWRTHLVVGAVLRMWCSPTKTECVWVVGGWRSWAAGSGRAVAGVTCLHRVGKRLAPSARLHREWVASQRCCRLWSVRVVGHTVRVIVRTWLCWINGRFRVVAWLAPRLIKGF